VIFAPQNSHTTQSNPILPTKKNFLSTEVKEMKLESMATEWIHRRGEDQIEQNLYPSIPRKGVEDHLMAAKM
jgi:hypothetical protein